MVKTNTQFSIFKRLISKVLTSLSLLLLTFGASAQSYSQPNHIYGCAYSATALRYGAIEEIVIEDANGNVIYSKNSDGCNNPAINGHYTLVESKSAFDLSAGSTYTIKIRQSNPAGYNGYNIFCGVWIDFNGDKDFADAGEFVVPNRWSIGYNSLTSRQFTVPCSGSTNTVRMRVRTDYQYGYGMTSTNHSNQLYYGETEDYTCDYIVPTSTTSDFIRPDTAYVGTPVTFKNSNQAGYISHNWSMDGTTYTSTNVNHVFAATGTYDVKLVSTNCNGSDSTTKQITIISPTAPPKSDFVANKSVYEIFETVKLTDLSTNGATYWDWVFVNPLTNDTIDGDDQGVLRGGDPFLNKNPLVNTGNYFGAVDIGVWDVYLTASNSIPGQVQTPKMGYVTVQRSSYNMGAGTALPANVISVSAGTIYDDGGQNGNYGNNKTTEALIAPCGAKSVTLDFTSFDLNSNATLKIYDGVNALGTPLHTGNGFTSGNAPTGAITANSGAMYLLWTSTTGTTAGGFAANWTSVAGSADAPLADYSFPSTTLYNAVYVEFTNTSLNAEGSTTFEWTLTGPDNTSANTRDFSYTFLTNGTYTLELKVIACDGRTSTKSYTFTVVAPNTPTNLDFVASTRRPSLGGDVTFTASSDKANNWEWTFFPNNGTDVTPNAPSATTSNVRSFTFNTPGTYTVQCRGYNSVDEAASEATVVKTAYIIVVSHCEPVIGVTTSEDIGINYVSISNPITGSKYENSSESGVEYTDYTADATTSLNFGGTYHFEIARNTAVNKMNRKVWIDWNVDGYFDDSTELVDAESAANTLSWTGSFTVPTIDEAFEATTRMRVGVSYNADDNEPCGASSNANANRIGEFEDYAIRVMNDGDMPYITLIDADTIYIEQVATLADVNYTSAGATATDPSQGDITANVKPTSDVDQTLPGIYYEIYNAMDASGNAADPVTRVVYVVSDQTAPVITVTGSADTTIEVGTAWIDLPATAIDNKEGNISSAIVVSGEVNVEVLGDYTITYSVRDNQGNASTATRIVRVVDTQVPVIDNPNADKSTTCWTVEVQLQNIFADVTLATDNYNSIGNGLEFKADPAASNGGASVDTRFQGTTSVTYTATDESGNVSTQCIDYVVRDYVPPVIDLRTLDVINHRVNTPYTPVNASASDNLYNNTQISLTSTSNVDAYTLGTYEDTYTATDAAGNVSVKVRTVNVIDDVAPVITGKAGGIVKIGVGSKVNAINFVNFSDNYDAPADLRMNHSLVFNDLNLQEAGLYSVIFKTADNSGNESREFTLYFDVDYDHQVLVNGISDLALADMIQVSPNPTNGPVNVQVNLPENEEVNIGIFNTMGQQVATVVNGKVLNGSFAVNLEGNANGMYYLKMSLNGTIITKKIILNN